MKSKKLLFFIVLAAGIALSMPTRLMAATKTTPTHPNFEVIRAETTNPDSEYYYPKLLKSFYSNDTTMTDDGYHYLYYGSMFQEDYNPYRPYPFADRLKATEPLYYKHGTLSRNEKSQIKDLAEKSLANNPLHLRQLMYLVYAYEQSGKQNLARIWKHKLDHLLLTISRSGTGADTEHAFVVVDPSHEFDYFNLSGVTVVNQEFQEPYYECVTVQLPDSEGTRQYWFDLHHLLEQYYAKHPSELED
ncbi:MAG: DUF4919 domain-containing protein [Muribaculaceae bacterium]|nr:DUF4919 domain-containing protein [Muribaculaceae bacterium]